MKNGTGLQPDFPSAFLVGKQPDDFLDAVFFDPLSCELSQRLCLNKGKLEVEVLATIS